MSSLFQPDTSFTAKTRVDALMRLPTTAKSISGVADYQDDLPPLDNSVKHSYLRRPGNQIISSCKLGILCIFNANVHFVSTVVNSRLENCYVEVAYLTQRLTLQQPTEQYHYTSNERSTIRAESENNLLVLRNFAENQPKTPIALKIYADYSIFE